MQLVIDIREEVKKQFEKEKYRLLLAFISGLISNKEEREKVLDYIKDMMQEEEKENDL